MSWLLSVLHLLYKWYTILLCVICLCTAYIWRNRSSRITESTVCK